MFIYIKLYQIKVYLIKKLNNDIHKYVFIF